MIPSPVTIFGGTGFVGRYIVRRLVREGVSVRVAVRHPERGTFVKSMGSVGQVSLVRTNIRDDVSVGEAIGNSKVVINAVGILYQRGFQTFQDIHNTSVQRLGTTARELGVKKFVHISAIGASSNSRSLYARTKACGESSLRECFPEAIFIRPSVVFGVEDDFFNRFAALARMLPIMPLIEGETKFQPVYVDNIAESVIAVLNGDCGTGITFEVGGPHVYSFRELLMVLFKQIGRRPFLVPLPKAATIPLAAIMQCFPKPPLTLDQLWLLGCDNIVSDDANTMVNLGVEATPLEAVIPRYLKRFQSGG